jgi:peptidoglycan hydrolase-like protein with peptidoglycan-binding domain
MNIVKEIQSQLKNKGYDPGPIDGDLGPKTLMAMKAYLSANVTPMVEKTVEKTKEVAKTVVEKVSPPPVVTIDANVLKGRDRPLYAMKVLMELGWKDYQAAAMVGQFMQESYADLRTNVWGDQKTAFGIGQWRDNYDRKTGVHSPGRLTDLLKFASDRKKPIDDLDTQVRFADWELRKGSEKAVGKRLAAAKNIDEALEAAIGYERPAGYRPDNPRNGHGWSNREKFAKGLL